jgi:hypothetical protein
MGIVIPHQMNINNVLDTSLDILVKSLFVLLPFWVTKGIILMNRKDKSAQSIDSKHKAKEWFQTIGTVFVVTAGFYFIPLADDGSKNEIGVDKIVALFIVILAGAIYGVYSANTAYKKQFRTTPLSK